MLEKREARPYKKWDDKQWIIFSQLVLDNNETPDQKNCKYCHEPYKPLIEISHLIEGLYNACLTGDAYINGDKLYFSIDSYDEGGETRSVKISHCPKCGRKLGD